MKKTLLEKLKVIIEAVKAAKTLYTLILLLLASLGYQMTNNVATEPVKAVESKIETIEPDLVSIIKETIKQECIKPHRDHSNRLHGGS